jgi:DNA-directed RNA polymerase sigma subunit (sigma70/sigma32)
VSNDKWDLGRSERLRATLSASDIEALLVRSEKDPKALTLDEVGVLFLVTRDKIRAIEAKARGSGNDR